MNTMVHNEAVERLRACLSNDEQRIIEVMERVKAEYLDSGWDDDLRRHFDSLVRTTVTRHSGEEGDPDDRRETRALVVVGEAGTGKTESLNHLFRTHPGLKGYRTLGSGCPLVTVSVPSPCTLKTLGMQILKAIGYPLSRDLKQHIVWTMVFDHLPLSGVLMLHLDEMHNLTDTANVDEIDTIRKTLKALMGSSTWPVGLVISGLPSIVPDLRVIDEIRRRGRFVRVPVLAMPDDDQSVRYAVERLASVAGLKVTEDLLAFVSIRLAHAGLNRFGIMVELIHEAIEVALVAGEPLTVESFATAYADRTGVGQLMNPFVAPNWHEVDCTCVLVDEPPAEPVLPEEPQGRKRAKGTRKPKKGGS